jgi:hypothetical protein
MDNDTWFASVSIMVQLPLMQYKICVCGRKAITKAYCKLMVNDTWFASVSIM